MSIIHLNSVSELNGHLSKSKDKVSVIDFHATWCGPCHAIAPTFESLSREYKNVNFFKCDVDAAKEVAEMPTFIFLKGSSKVDQVRGANAIELKSTLKRLATSASASAFTGRGQTLGSGASEPVDVSKEAAATLNKAASKVTNLDPQLRVLLGLIAGYAMFWYLSR
ncbi:thioredoxin-domain-containing protein [Mycena alexandri]|uniref:Thioredoxin-domain-containing protein n=1 Tax=Mycena alexandri TaxID=1745969 RepID=A0AAD6T7U3_9AGAR|nr:thioredoxin-domain-containing protein [Mycena alexandri]